MASESEIKYNEDFLSLEKLDFGFLETESIDQTNYLQIQLEEIEVLQSMYYQDKEFVIDEDMLSLAKNYARNTCLQSPPCVDYVVNVIVDHLPLEIQVFLPKQYPSAKPTLFVRCQKLLSNQLITLNTDLKKFILSTENGLICVMDSIFWIISHALKYQVTDSVVTKVENTDKYAFTRYWIYSHHIYSKAKRKLISSLAKELNISGFCLSGKPGIVCGEGWETDCEIWWQRIRNLTWKKINCIHRETEVIPISRIDFCRRFDGFCEINFEKMGEFHKYLMTRDCGYIFKNYFGFEKTLNDAVGAGALPL